MTDTITYKNYIGSVQFSQEDNVFYGKLKGVNDLVTFECESVSELNTAFREAVDDYEELCELIKKE